MITVRDFMVFVFIGYIPERTQGWQCYPAVPGWLYFVEVVFCEVGLTKYRF